MMTQNRQESMLQLIREKGQVSIAELKIFFPDVSEMTIRRDIDQFKIKKQVLRVPGGVKSIESVIEFVEDRYAMRSLENNDLKQMIVQKAIGFIKPHMCIFLDSGSTTTLLAHMFPDVECIVCTTGITCAYELSKLKNVKTIMFGGWVNSNSLSTYGNCDMSNIFRSNFDIAFMGVTGYDDHAGFTTGMYDEGVLKRTVIGRSKSSVFLMDSSKIGRIFPSTFAEVEDVDFLISDENINVETRKKLEEKGVVLL